MVATALLAIFAFIADIFIMPWYVKSEEVKVPNVVGMSKEQASDLLSDSNLNVIIEGPPGTGKTLLARAVAHHTDCCFIRVSGSELVQKYIGEGARMVRELFVMAR